MWRIFSARRGRRAINGSQWTLRSSAEAPAAPRSVCALPAGLDGIKNKIEPPAPIDKNIYELPPEE